MSFDPIAIDRLRRCSRALLFLTAISLPSAAYGQDQSARIVEVFLNQSVAIPFAGVSHVLVVDEHICQVAIDAGLLTVTGLHRGETIVLVWTTDHLESLRVQVESPPAPPIDEQPTREELDGMGHGTVGTFVHVAAASANTPSVTMVTPFAWTEGAATRRFSMNGQVQQTRAADVSNLTLDVLSAQWIRGKTTATLVDFTTDLDGGTAARITPSTRAGAFALRGADVVVAGERSSYELFAGSTLPLFAASRQLAGVTFTRHHREHRYIDATTAAVSAPVVVDGTRVARQSSVFQTVGLTERLNDRAAVQVRGGAGSRGVYGQVASTWQSELVSGFVRASRSSPGFGLNQLQLLYAPQTDLQTAVNWSASRRVSAGVGYIRSETEAAPLFPARSASDYVSTTANIAVTHDHIVFVNGVWNRHVGGLGNTGQLTGRRLETGLGSRLGRNVRNDFQLSVGSLADPLQRASRGQFTVRDTLGVAGDRGSLNLSVAHDRLSPSLVARLHDNLSLLAPALRSLFLDDPVAFVQSSQVPTEVRQLLASLEPIDTQIVMSGQFNLGPRFAINPTASYQHSAQSSTSHTNIATAGYGLTWHMTPTLDVTSSLSNALIFDPRRQDLARTTILAVGLRKTFRGEPRWIPRSGGYRIQGRVFRDVNLNGIDDQRDVGVPDVVVRLGDQRAVHTDERGRFEFSGLTAGEYRVLMALDQFGPGVRVTTPIDPVLRLYERHVTEVGFGVVNFSRLVGTVFNDYALDGVHQGDAPGLRQVAVVIAGNEVERRIVTDAAGDFEIDDLPPGRYQISVDSDTLPGNYESPKASVDVDMGPSTTVTVGIPVHALRSIEGHVYLRNSSADDQGSQTGGARTVRPLKGIKVMAGGAIVATDESGRFVLRDLPAGEVFVSLVPNGPVPPELRVPVGRLRMPMEPTQVEDATIIIDNPRLLEYLVDRANAGGQ